MARIKKEKGIKKADTGMEDKEQARRRRGGEERRGGRGRARGHAREYLKH
jgi:hypothetical protein